MLQKNSNL